MGYPISQKLSGESEPNTKHKKEPPIVRVSSPPPSYAHAWDDIEAGPSVPLQPLMYAPSLRSGAPYERPTLLENPEHNDVPAARATRRRAKHWKFTIPLGTMVGIAIGAYVGVHFRAHRAEAAPAAPMPPTSSGALSGAYTLSGETALSSSNCNAFATCIVPFQTTLSFSGSGLSAQVFAPTTQYTGSVNASGPGQTFDFVWKDLQIDVGGCAQRRIGQVHVEMMPDGTARGVNHDFVEMLEDCAALSTVAKQSCQCDTQITLSPEMR